MISLPGVLQDLLDSRSAFRVLIEATATRGTVTRELEVLSGRLTWDQRRTIFGDGEIQVPVTDLPTRPSDLLTPFGTTVTLRAGIEAPSGESATIPAGVFLIDASRAEISPDARSVSLPLIDAAQTIAGYRFEEPFQTPAGDLAAAIRAVIGDRTGSTPALADTGVSIGVRTFGLDTETNPWQEIVKLAANFGFRLFYDRAGEPQLQAANPPGSPRALTPVTVAAAFDRRPANIVVARGEPADGSAPVQAVAVDDNPSSPTYAGTGPGQTPYGRITRFFASPLLSTTGQATLAAETILEREIAAGAAWSLTRAFDPTVEPGDVVSFEDDTETFIVTVDAVTVGIGDVTTIEARELVT